MTITIIRKLVIVLVHYCSWHGTETKFHIWTSFQQCTDFFITSMLLWLLMKRGETENAVMILADKLHIKIKLDMDLEFGCKYVGGEGWDHVGQLHVYVEYGLTIFSLKK